MVSRRNTSRARPEAGGRDAKLRRRGASDPSTEGSQGPGTPGPLSASGGTRTAPRGGRSHCSSDVGEGAGATSPREAELEAALADPSFNPRKADASILFGWIDSASEARARVAIRALARMGEWAAAEAVARLTVATPPGRARLVRLVGRVGRVANGEGWVDRLGGWLADGDPRTRREAAIALGKLGAGHAAAARAEAHLLDAWLRCREPSEQRSVAEALGKVGGAAALGALEAHAVGRAPEELGRVVRQATTRIDRTLGRDQPSAIDARRRPARPVRALLHCRPGLEPLVCDELGPRAAARIVGPGRVLVRLDGPLARLTGVRTALRVVFPLPPRPIGRFEAVSEALADVLCSRLALALFDAWTVGPKRYRIEWRDAGHRRGAVWECAGLVATRCPELVNDPTASSWQVNVTERGRGQSATLWCELWPRGWQDDRFTYRVRDVPAASHPTVAAALARLAGARPDDVVWDPFVGSGTELVERSLLGPYRRLLGSDLDGRALDAAGANLRAAAVERFTLQQADATTHVPSAPPSLILTNPPMGRRLLDRVVIGPLLERVLLRSAELLVPGGRMVWASPLPDRTAEAAERAGLRVAERLPVDLGGIRAEIQRFDRP